MSVAVIYDIHGNLPALEAVFKEIDQLQVNQIVVGGDVIVGPMSRECLDYLQEVSVPISFIKGNCETAVLDVLMGKPLSRLPETVVEEIEWTAKQMNSSHKSFMEQWPMDIEMEIEGIGRVFFCHATPRNENEIFTKLTAEEKLAPIFNPLSVDLVVCGHTHMQFDRSVGTTRIVNAGSVGMPFGKPGAYWLLLDETIQLMRTEYDLEKTSKVLKKSGYPNATEFADISVCNPPSEETMLEVFKNAELN